MSFWKRRSIRMPAPVDPEKFEVTYGMGLREAVLVSLAAVQAIWLIFLVERMPFIVRLGLAALIAAVLLVFALVPYKDKPIEYSIAKWLRYRFGSQGRVYRTASREGADEELMTPAAKFVATPVQTRAAVQTPVAQIQPKVLQPKRPRLTQFKPAETHRSRRYSVQKRSRWMQPDPGLIMAAFLGVLVVGSVLAYVGRGGHFKPIETIAAMTKALAIQTSAMSTSSWTTDAEDSARSPWH